MAWIYFCSCVAFGFELLFGMLFYKMIIIYFLLCSLYPLGLFHIFYLIIFFICFLFMYFRFYILYFLSCLYSNARGGVWRRLPFLLCPNKIQSLLLARCVDFFPTPGLA
jgi:hypothetical protein